MKKKNFYSPFGSPNNGGPNTLIALLMLILLFMGYLVWYNALYPDIETVSYSTLIEAVENNKISHVVVHDNGIVEGRFIPTYKEGHHFKSEVITSPEFIDKLTNHRIHVDIQHEEQQGWLQKIILTLLLVAVGALVFFYMRTIQPGNGGPGKLFNIGKSKARLFPPNSITVTFKDVAGVEEAKEELQDIIEFLKTPEKFEKIGAKVPRGVLLCGEPGNGKTLLAKAVAGEASCAFFSISGADFVEVFVGVGASRVRDLFAQARKVSPCIIFIDEIDAVGRQRGASMSGGNDEREQTLNQLLSEMDGFSTERGAVIVIAATNRPDVLDKALLRPGRFDRTIEVPYPDMKSREYILKVHSRGIPLASEIDLERIAQGTSGFSGAQLESLMNEAALFALKAGRETVTIHDLEQARDKIVVGAERKTLLLTDEDKRLTAYHEGGHALVNLLLPEADPFHKVTIVPRGRALGVSWSLPERDKHNYSRSGMLARIKVALGGLLAEKLIFSEQTTGASSDILQATRIARRMVIMFGMSDLGPIALVDPQDMYKQGINDYSPQTAEKIDHEVKKIIDQCYSETEKLLTDNKERLELLATTLLEKETLHADEAYELLNLTPRKSQRFEPTRPTPQEHEEPLDAFEQESDVQPEDNVSKEKE